MSFYMPVYKISMREKIAILCYPPGKRAFATTLIRGEGNQQIFMFSLHVLLASVVVVSSISWMFVRLFNLISNLCLKSII